VEITGLLVVACFGLVLTIVVLFEKIFPLTFVLFAFLIV
jgi:hypothetical protein